METRPLQWYDWLLPPRRFAPAVERDYLYRWKLDHTLRLQRFAGWLAALMYVSALCSDLLLGRHQQEAWLFWPFYCGSALLAACLPISTYFPRLHQRAYDIAFFTLMINGCALIGITVVTYASSDPFPPAWTLQLMFYTFVLNGMPYRYSVPLGAALGIVDMCGALYLRLPPSELTNRVLLDASMILSGVIACSLVERSDRQNFQRARQMHTQSYIDELTGLHNRRYLFEEGARRIAQVHRRDLPIAVMMIDVDYFKRYNDSQGHPAGDRCLRELGACFTDSTPHALDIPVRLGGEEFAVLMFGCNNATALAAAEKLRSEVERLAIPHPSAPLGHVTVSIGVASGDALGKSDLEALLLAADKGLYRAKEAGRNTVRA